MAVIEEVTGKEMTTDRVNGQYVSGRVTKPTRTSRKVRAKPSGAIGRYVELKCLSLLNV